MSLPSDFCLSAALSRRRTIIGPRKTVRMVLLMTIMAVFYFAVISAAAMADDMGSLADEFLNLKLSFEKQALELAGKPDQAACLGAETTALAWALAAGAIAVDDSGRQRWEQRIALFKNKAADDLEKRLLDAVWLYYDAFYEVSLSLAQRGDMRSLEAELKAMREDTSEKLYAVIEKPGAGWEKKTIISETLTHFSSAVARAMGGAPMRRPAGEAMSRLMNKTSEIDLRADLHYRARMRLLYLAHIRELASMTFLIGLSVGPPISGQMASIHAELNRHGSALASETHSEGLIWTAQAQASLPLAYWMATVRKGDNANDVSGETSQLPGKPAAKVLD